ncbi:MAG TPA: hypothetical protein VGE47_02495 [Burkholderiaceae bacterium]
MRISHEQTVCQWAGAVPLEPQPHSKLGLAFSTIGKLPINGVRHEPTEGTSGWYIWCGVDLSEDPEFFAPLHIEHLAEYMPEVIEYLNLPPGYRFLIDGNNYEDVWFDPALLEA